MESLFPSTFLFYIDAKRISTKSGKEKVKKESFLLLEIHISKLQYRYLLSRKDERPLPSWEQALQNIDYPTIRCR